MNGRKRSTIRFRLTMLYAGAFFLAGAILIALTYLYLQQSLERRPGGGAAVVQQFLSERGVQNPPPILDRLLSAVAAQVEQERRDTLRGMLTWSLISLAAVGAAAVGFGWLLAGRALHPLHQITATARRVADHSLHERISFDGPDDEIKELADTFDAMLERLDRAFDGQRRFVANASHELRTPLAINRTLIEVALDDPDVADSTSRLGVTLLEVNKRHERLIEGLLVLAGSEQRLDRKVTVNLAEIVDRVSDTAHDAAQRAGVHLQCELTPVAVRGDPTMLERLVQNLIDNAIRYNIAQGGWVSVTVTVAHPLARLTVENSGPVVAPEEVHVLFEPFRRLAASERIADTGQGVSFRGAGLGLSIVRSVAQAHNGNADALARPDGGLAVIVTVPMAS